MPSASSKPQGTQQNTPGDLLQEPLKCALSVAEKKLRNLEKRRLKLAETKKKADKGEKLNEDQKTALKSLESVDFGLDAVRDVQKLLSTLEQEYTKLLKKDQKKQKQEQKDVLETFGHKYVFDIVDIQSILGEMSEEVRPDFLSGSNGACQLTETELENLDTIYEYINPAASEDKSKKLAERSKSAGQHLISLVENKTSPIVEGVTYKDVNDTLQKIKLSGYFDKEGSSNGETSATEIETGLSAKEEKPEEAIHNEEVQQIEEQAEAEVATEEYPEEQPAEDAAVEPVNGVALPPEVQTTPEEEGINFMAESEISAVVQEASLNPVSPEFVPRKMQPQQESGFDNEGDSNDSNWQQIEGGHHNQGNNYRGRGRGRGNYRGRGGNRGGNSGNYRGSNREYRGSRGGNRGSNNYRGNRDGGRGNYRGNREGGRGNYRGGQQQQQ